MSKLKDVIDLDLWKNIQDKFAKSIKLPVATIDEKGNEIIVSGKCGYFCQLVKSKLNAKYIVERKKFFEKLKTKEEKILVYNSHDGMLNIMVPICVGEEQVAAIVCGEILRSEENVAKCRRLSSETGLPTLELLEAIKQKRMYGINEVQSISSMIYLLSQTVPEVVHGKFQSDKKVNELTALNKISGIINNTLELKPILNSIISFMKQSLESKECSIIIFENNTRFGNSTDNEDLLELEKKVINQVLRTKSHSVIELQKDMQYSGANIPYNNLISLPMISKDNVLGVINIYDYKTHLDEDSLSFLNILSSQAAMAIINAQQYEQIKQMAITDKLTGLYNRRHFFKILETEIERAKRGGLSFSVVLIDVDDFTQYNNTSGHVAGDKLLAQLGEILKENVRNIDTVGRYGGEEFIIILPDADFHQSQSICERIRQKVKDFRFDNQEKQPNGNVTISVGFVNCRDTTLPTERIIEKSDKALYKAKDSGKNKVKYNIIVRNELIT